MIRPWTAGDLDAIAALEAECFSYPWSRRMLAECLLSDRFFGLLEEEEGRLVGYGGVEVTFEIAEIQLIAVGEMYRRCGRGGEILEELLSLAREKGAEKAFLEVRVSNAAAQILYLKHGFRGLYCRTRYYPDGEDAIVMTKELG